MLKKISILIVSSVSLFAMHTVELNINDLELEAGVKLDMGQFNDSIEPDTTFVGVTYINASEENSRAPGGGSIQDIGGYFNLNFLIMQEVKESGLSVGLGIKTVFASIDNPDLKMFTAIPLGVEVKYVLPFEKVVPIWLAGKIYYAPQSLSFSDSRSYSEYRAEANFEVIQRGTLYLGFRNIDTNYKVNGIESNYTFNRSGYFGFKFAF